MWPAVPLLSIYSKRIESRVLNRYLYTQIHSRIIHNSPKGEALRTSIAEGWVSKMWRVESIEYCSAFKRKEILTHATTWGNLEVIVLSETR